MLTRTQCIIQDLLHDYEPVFTCESNHHHCCSFKRPQI